MKMNTTRKIERLLIVLLTGVTSICAQNPIADYYGDEKGYPYWTDEILWENKIDMSIYSNGATELDKFNNARDELYDIGGGVLYYPAGTYSFTIPDGPANEGLMLKKGVVITGEKPASDLSAVTSYDAASYRDSTAGLQSLPTRFVFSTKSVTGGEIPKMWNCIGMKKGNRETSLGEVAHVGVAWIEIHFGFIYFGFDVSSWNPTWSDDGAEYDNWLGLKAFNGWENRIPDGTHVMDPLAGLDVWGYDSAELGEKMFVFGCNLKNAAVPNYVINKAGLSGFEFDAGSWKYAGKISAYGRHIFIANNVIDKPTACFLYTGPTANMGNQTLLFNYGNGAGITVNGDNLSGVYNRCRIKDPNSGTFSEDIIVMDNWVYNQANRGFYIRGKWVTIKGNVNYREYMDLVNDYYGVGLPACYQDLGSGQCRTGESPDDYMSRAFELGGWNVWVDSNFYRNTGSGFSNDGEGILIQRYTGYETYSFAITRNEQNGSAGDNGYIAPYNTHVIGLLTAWN
jgi:hypothetical protein